MAPKAVPAPGRAELPVRAFLIASVLHIPLAVAVRYAGPATLIHMVLVLAVGIHWAARGSRPERTIYVAAYAVGCELIWRGSGTILFWEFSKYFLAALCVILVVRYRLTDRLQGAGILFALLFLPSLFVLPYFDRGDVAFNISGPVCLGLVWASFGALRLPRRELVMVLFSYLVPILSLCFLSTFGTVSSSSSKFLVGGKATTAGIGPNQVSSQLGLGLVMVFFLFFLLPPRQVGSRRIFIGLGVWLGVQCLLSFSRGGIWGALGTMALATPLLLQNRRARRYFIGGAIVVIPLLQFALLPAADRLSDGIALDRFQQTDLTGRDKIMLADLQAFREHPLLGVGPGQAKYYHALTFRLSSAHTEYTRALAEHGLLGLVALLLLGVQSVSRVLRPGTVLQRAMFVGFTTWPLLYMGHSAMRLAAPALVFGLAVAELLPEDRLQGPTRKRTLVRPPSGSRSAVPSGRVG